MRQDPNEYALHLAIYSSIRSSGASPTPLLVCGRREQLYDRVCCSTKSGICLIGPRQVTLRWAWRLRSPRMGSSLPATSPLTSQTLVRYLPSLIWVLNERRWLKLIVPTAFFSQAACK